MQTFPSAPMNDVLEAGSVAIVSMWFTWLLLANWRLRCEVLRLRRDQARFESKDSVL